MLNEKKIIVVMPAYNAEKTLQRTYQEIPHHIVDEVILVQAIVRREMGLDMDTRHAHRRLSA